MSHKPRISPEVAAKLGYYVYAYVDPRTSQIFYVGKGCRGRVLAHLDDQSESEKSDRIKQLADLGLKPLIDILAHGMTDEETALRVEAAVIDVLQPGKALANRVRGNRAVQFGRMPLEDLDALYAAKPTTIREPAILIRINRLYRPRMSAEELYDATRGVWKLGARRYHAPYAIAVYQGVVRQVYEIQEWHRAGTTRYAKRKDVNVPGRWEFTGTVAQQLSKLYTNGSVAECFSPNCQNPTVYVNC